METQDLQRHKAEIQKNGKGSEVMANYTRNCGPFEKPNIPKPPSQNPNRNIEEPPLGLMPKYVWMDKRIQAIKEAIQRFMEREKQIPIKWVTEYNDLLKDREEELWKGDSK